MREGFVTIAVQVVCYLMIRMFKSLISYQGYFARPYYRTVGRANIVTTLLAVALAKAKQITPTDRVSISGLF
jgi:hypothetical protein